MIVAVAWQAAAPWAVFTVAAVVAQVCGRRGERSEVVEESPAEGARHLPPDVGDSSSAAELTLGEGVPIAVPPAATDGLSAHPPLADRPPTSVPEVPLPPRGLRAISHSP